MVNSIYINDVAKEFVCTKFNVDLRDKNVNVDDLTKITHSFFPTTISYKYVFDLNTAKW